MTHQIAFAAAFLLCLGYTCFAGGRPERAAICAQLIALLLSLFAISFRSIPAVKLPIGLALVDASLAVALTILALRANRIWPIVLAGMQVATIFAHLAKVLSFPLPPAGYVIFVQFWSWPMLIVTALGTYRHRTRTTRFGDELDWKPLWPHSTRAASTT